MQLDGLAFDHFWFGCLDPQTLHSFPTRRSSDLGAQLRLRGISTINGLSSPLYVIDGVIVDRKSTRLNSSHRCSSYAVFCLKKKSNNTLLEANISVRASISACIDSVTCTAIWSPSKSALNAEQTSGCSWMALPSIIFGSDASIPRLCTLSLHDALPISARSCACAAFLRSTACRHRST